MSSAAPPPIEAVDHVHVYVANRLAAEDWYREVLGFTRIDELEFWAAGGGPLTVQNVEGTVHIALFERPSEKCRSTIALRVSAASFIAWKARLGALLESEPSLEDHQASLSLYFQDPDGNPYEITTYEYASAKTRLAVL